MTTFQEFLQKKAEEQHLPQRRQEREEWVAAVGRLLDQLRAWLAEADPDQVLAVVPLELLRVEPRLGSYRIPGLGISLNDATRVRVEPVGRYAIGTVRLRGAAGVPTAGRVDITDRVQRYILYRTLQGDQEMWYALDEQFEAAPLDQTRLEAILQDLLS